MALAGPHGPFVSGTYTYTVLVLRFGGLYAHIVVVRPVPFMAVLLLRSVCFVTSDEGAGASHFNRAKHTTPCEALRRGVVSYGWGLNRLPSVDPILASGEGRLSRRLATRLSRPSGEDRRERLERSERKVDFHPLAPKGLERLLSSTEGRLRRLLVVSLFPPPEGEALRSERKVDFHPLAPKGLERLLSSTEGRLLDFWLSRYSLDRLAPSGLDRLALRARPSPFGRPFFPSRPKGTRPSRPKGTRPFFPSRFARPRRMSIRSRLPGIHECLGSREL